MFTAYRSLSSYLAAAPVPEKPAIEDHSLFSRLPYELREQIYTDFFADHAYSSLYISPDSKSILSNPVAEGTHHTALLRTCKAIYAEALPIMHKTHDVHLLVSDPPALERMSRADHSVTVAYLPKTHVCSQQSMLQLLQNRITRVSITVQLHSFSPSSPIVQKIAWLLEVLQQRETKLESLTLHVYDNLVAYSGCCQAQYAQGTRWDVHPETVILETSRERDLGKDSQLGDELLGKCAEEWKVAVSMNEGRLAMGQKPQGHWKRLVQDLWDVERVLKEQGSWWNKLDLVTGGRIPFASSW